MVDVGGHTTEIQYTVVEVGGHVMSFGSKNTEIQYSSKLPYQLPLLYR